MNISNVLAAYQHNNLQNIKDAQKTQNTSARVNQTDASFSKVLQNQLVNQENQKSCTCGKSGIDQSSLLLYQKLLMQQASLMSYGMNPYSGYGYNNLYGLSGGSSYNMMQNYLLYSMVGKLF